MTIDDLYNSIIQCLDSCPHDCYISFGCQNCVMWSFDDHLLFDVIFPGFKCKRVECNSNQLKDILSNKLSVRDISDDGTTTDFLSDFGFDCFIDADISPDELHDTLPEWFIQELVLWRLQE